MKIACCLFKYFPYGGLQRDFLRLAKALEKQGHSIHVYTMSCEGDLPESFEVTLIPVTGQTNHQRSLQFAENLPRYLKRDKPDCVVGFNKIPGLDIYFAADPCYVAKAKQKHGFWYRFMRRYRIYAKLENAVFNPQSSTQILLLAAREAKEFIRYHHTPENRFHLLPPGIDPKHRLPEDHKAIRALLRREFSLRDSDRVMLLVGSGFKTKGVDRAILALKSLPASIRLNTFLWVIGKGDPMPFMKMAKKCGVQKQIYFLGGREDVSKFLWSADLLIHPAYTENTGSVLLEALVAGLPVLTTEACGYANYIEEAKAGVVLKCPFQQKMLNTTLIKMLTDQKQKDFWREHALQFAAHHDLNGLVKQAVDFIESFQRAK